MEQWEPPELTLQAQIRQAIHMLRSKIRWKPGKDVQHLQTRMRYGHLPASMTVAEYESIINGLLNDSLADIYTYTWDQAIYPTIVSFYQDRRWLVMFGLNGVMETAFLPTDPDEYLADVRFRYISKMQEFIL